MLISLHFASSRADQILFQQGEQHDAGRFLDFIEHAIELLLAAHQRIDMFDRRHIGVLRRHRPRHRDQGLAGRIGDQVKMKIVAGRGHRDPCVSCESLWSLTERIGRGWTGRDNPAFSSQASPRDKLLSMARDDSEAYVDLSLHKPAVAQRKGLKTVVLFAWPDRPPEMLMNVNKGRQRRDSVVWAQSTAT